MNQFKHSVQKIPTCDIFGVPVAVTNMEEMVQTTLDSIEQLRGEYYCVSNVHTIVMAADVKQYRSVQQKAAIVLPDGAPLSKLCRKRGFEKAKRVTGPDFMEQVFLQSEKDGKTRHFFYGSTPETLEALRNALEERYPHMQIAGMYSPPFRPLTKEEDREIVEQINKSHSDFIWIGLGAPKQEIWMYHHRKQLNGLMVGVGAGFNYHAGLLKRAPLWMQKHSLEWLYRLMQEPGRLWKRYLQTNLRFAFYAYLEEKKQKK